MIRIVLGTSFGDEGKGKVVSSLIQQNTKSKRLVVRFNGGHQVGHTVVHEGVHHVFSNFGSGSLQGVPTYWSRFCTIHPLGIINENDVLGRKGCTPVLYIDPLCPVVTPFDIIQNQSLETTNKHGSVGVGFGTTIQRQERYYKLFAQDLLFESVTRLKLSEIAKYYKWNDTTHLELMIDEFIYNVNEMLSLSNVMISSPPLEFNNVIFEGGQGILLDQDFGFFPHVTRSNTTSKNAITLINEFKGFGSNNTDLTQMIYVTRPYLTRHGNGPLPFEYETSPVDTPNETNVYNQWQGGFRYAPLNIDLLRYSLRSDNNYSSQYKDKHLWVTCADQVPDVVDCIVDNNIQKVTVKDIYKMVGLDKQYTKYEP